MGEGVRREEGDLGVAARALLSPFEGESLPLGQLASCKMWANALSLQLRSPAHGQTAACSPEAVENLAAQGALRVLGKECDVEAVLQSRSNEIRITVKEVGDGPPTKLPLLTEFEGDPVSLWRLLHWSVQSVRVAQVGHVALIVCRVAWVPRCVVAKRCSGTRASVNTGFLREGGREGGEGERGEGGGRGGGCVCVHLCVCLRGEEEREGGGVSVYPVFQVQLIFNLQIQVRLR